MSTIKDVARVSGYSISTVSYALNEHPSIPADTKKKIKAIAQSLNYVPNRNAQRLKRQKKDVIGVFINGIGGPIHSELINAISETSAAIHYDVMILLGNTGKKILRSNLIDAAIIMSDAITDDDIHFVIEKYKLPIIVLDRIFHCDHVSMHLIDNQKGIKLLLEKLYENGKRYIAFLSGNTLSLDNQEREQTYRQFVKVHPELSPVIYQGDFTEKSGYEVFMKQIYPSLNRFDALVCSNDEMAIGCINAATELGINLLDKIKITGFDNIQLDEYVTPKLTTVKVDRQQWGKQVVDSIVSMIEKNKEVPQEVRQTVEIIYRDSL